MINSKGIRDAILLAIKAHETDQQQKRKGKDIPYITHPLSVALILARAGADEDTIAAGILHDTIEDSADEHRVTAEFLGERFGESVAQLVESVTKPSQPDDAGERMRIVIASVASYSQRSVLIKSADVLANDWELLQDFEADGDTVFDRFNSSKTDKLDREHLLIEALLARWPASPLAVDLRAVKNALPTLPLAESTS